MPLMATRAPQGTTPQTKQVPQSHKHRLEVDLSDIDTDSRIEHESDATETEDAYNDQNGEPSPEPGVSEASERERESSTEEVSDDDVEREKVRAKEQYMNELQEQREKLLHQQTLERQQQQWQEERDDASGGESKPAQRTSGKTLLDKERERLLQQQQQQQQHQEGHVEERGNRQSQINVESVTNSQQSLYDSGREEQPENADRGIRESGEDGDSGEKGRDGGTPGARGEGGDLGAGDIYQRGVQLVNKVDPVSKAQGYALLREAADSGHSRALEQVAYAHLVGSALERNFTWSFEKFSALAEMGNPVGQQGLGFMYSTGIGVNSSQAKALLYYTFAALGGHHFAQMTMGYRSLMGITVGQSCETALYYYQMAAKKVADEVTIVTGGLLISKVRLMEEDDEATNVYGVSEDDMIHYHDVFTDSGNTGAQDYEAAMEHFQKAKDMGHADGCSGMGMLYYFGMGVEQDYIQALELFQMAADKGSAEAQYYLGHMFREGYGTKRNLNKAVRYFQLASHGGHLLAIYSLAEMHAEGQAVKRNCNYAVELFKGVAERGQWTRMMEDAERSYEAGDLDSALMVYLLMAEMGLEVAQTNAAYILEQEGLSLVQEKETLKRALILWNRSASQGYAMARVKLGDYYYYGQGTEVNYEAAASQYRIASDKQSSAQAMFNLAYMYQQGYGLKKDYHLAKRYYDLAAETSGEANVPVTLALLNLNVLYYFDWLSEPIFPPTLQAMSSPETVAEVEAVAGQNWDVYLIAFLSGLLALVFMWRWRY
ncbi:Protein sel-1 homolog 1 [Geodia barretti]|uniref:Protein sel-1 homolog 1 n=1 Tax=Geodia barretti TaxID=519541 RepID=A0AA35T856_GEOBA|nr:Protein sel-1 homolog 1 [Geodia barretti]